MYPVAVLAWLVLGLFAAEAASTAPAEEVRPVRTIVAIMRAEGEPVSVTGHIRARTDESLAFRVDGKLIARRIGIGQMVKPGDLVAELDPLPQQDALRAAQARHVAAQAVFEEASKNLYRKKTLLASGTSTAAQVDAAEQTYRSAQAQVDSAAAQLHSAEDQLSYTNLRADAQGVVIATGAEAGEVVRAGQMIVTVAHQDGADAVFDVPASLMRRVSPDAEISVELSDDPNIHTFGRVREVGPQADPVTRSHQVKVGLIEWPTAMQLGATVTGRTHMRAPAGTELPATALTSVDNKPAVWVVDPNSYEVSLRSVELERQDSGSIIVTGGLKAGEIVVTAGVHALRPGQKVRLLGATQ